MMLKHCIAKDLCKHMHFDYEAQVPEDTERNIVRQVKAADRRSVRLSQFCYTLYLLIFTYSAFSGCLMDRAGHTRDGITKIWGNFQSQKVIWLKLCTNLKINLIKPKLLKDVSKNVCFDTLWYSLWFQITCFYLQKK